MGPGAELRVRRWGAWVGTMGAGVAALVMLVTPAEARAQGWIEPQGTVNGAAVSRVGSQVEVSVDGRVALVEVTEWFRNDGPRVAEGHYLYPLPGEAVFQGFSLFQGEEELRGEVMDADRARSIYQEIVRRRADPALLELAGQGLIRARVFPIEPGQERKVTLRYTQLLNRAGNALQLRYAAGVRGAAEGMRPEPTGSLPEEEAASRASTRFRVTVAGAEAFLDPFSPTHTLSVTRGEGTMEVLVEAPLERRLSVFLPFADEHVGLALATHRPAGEDGYLMLTLSPGRSEVRSQPRDVTVVLDVSGSMSGEKIRQARSALHALLGTLDRDDRFRLITFSNAVRRYREGWTRAEGTEVEDARAWVSRIGADGGTHIEAALSEAFRLESPDDRLPLILFLTDGLPSVGERSPERLADRAEAQVGRARVFAFGVGHDVNTHLLDRLGEAGRGSTGYVQPGEDVERAVGLLAAKIRHPVLTELEIEGAPVRFTEIYPVTLPDLFAGEELVIFGRYQGSGDGPVRIRGHRAGGVETFRVTSRFPERSEANDFIPRLWASRKLGHLTRQIWTEGETPGLVEQIRSVALRYGLPSRYTSYLVTEPDLVMADLDGFPGPGGGRAVAAAAAAKPPMAATGVQAVRQAEEARRMRETSSSLALDRAESEMKASLERQASADELRLVGGRPLILLDGVWTDQTPRSTEDTRMVEPFSAAWFTLLEAMPELRDLSRLNGTVLLHGARVNLRFEDGGDGSLSVDEVLDVVKRFRGVQDR
ncbi:MAG: VIT domain-containing protein [Gemmatimonadota bacterium]